jgi:hypothetical protein
VQGAKCIQLHFALFVLDITLITYSREKLWEKKSFKTILPFPLFPINH